MPLGSVYNAFPNGRPSGLPTDIVDQLVNAREQQVVQPIQGDIEEAKAEKDTYFSLNSSLRDLYTAADSLDSVLSFSDYSASSSNADALTGSAGMSAQPSTYDVDVSSLAKSHHLLLGVQDAEAGVNQGVSDPDDASLIQAGTTLSFYRNGTEHSYTTDSETTLTSLAETISDDDNGVTAQALNVGSDSAPQYVLSLKSESTGDGQNQITQDEAGTTTGLTLSGSLFLDSGGSALSNELEDARLGQNATLTVDGVDFERSSNEISDVISGVTLSLNQTATDIQLTVELDTEGITEKVKSVVDGYNAFMSFMDENADYNQQTGQAGPLLGDSLARGAQNRLRTIVSSPVSGTEESSFQYLSQVGIQIQRDGSLDFDTEAFAEALKSDREGVEKLFYGEGSVSSKLSSFLREYTSPLSGTVPKAIESTENKIEDLNEDLDDAHQDLNRYEERLIDKYSQLESRVQQYQSFGDQISSLIDTWDTE